MQVYIGIDWSERKHDLIFTNEAGGVIQKLVVPHNLEGFQQIDEARAKLGVQASECILGIETAHSLLLDFLWDREYQAVYVLPPNVVRSSQGRYRQSGARSDQSDAWLIADILRTDRQRYHPWTPGSPLLQQIRVKVSMLNYLSKECQRMSNRLRAVLTRYYPVAANLFSSLTAQIALAFIQAYPTPQAAAELSFEAFQAFARQQGHVQTKRLPRNYACLQRLQPVPEATTTAYSVEAQLLSRLLMELVVAKNQAERDVQELFQQHPDAFIFQSLPRAGDFLEPALLVKFGEDRQRFPTATSIQALAGTCPVTDASGKRKTVKFRYACDHEFRHIAQQWALATLKESTWAIAYYEQVRPKCSSTSHAIRCLANRWLAVVWKLWQTRQTYDEGYHLQQRMLRCKPRP